MTSEELVDKIAAMFPTAVPSGTKDKDLMLWRAWKKSQMPHDLQALINQMNPIILREVNKWAAGASRSFLEMEGKRLAVEAFKSYDPNAGTALSTYLTTRLQKISRPVYATQNAVRLPENKTLLLHNYLTAQTMLRDTHGRDPTSDEMADHLGWAPKRLAKFQREALRKEFVESEDHPDDEDAEDHLVDYVYHDLTPLQKSIFEHRTGYLGAPQLSGAAIQKKLKLSAGQLSHQVSTIEKVIKKAQGR